MASKRNAHPAGKEPSQRQLRVGELIRHSLATHLMREAEGDHPISVTEVRPSPDLKRATAFVIALGADRAESEFAVKQLNKMAGHFRHLVNGDLTLKFSPEIKFALDGTFDEAGHIDSLLKSEKVSRDLSDDEDDT